MCLAQDSVSPRARRRAYVRGPALQILEKLLGVYEAFPLTVAEAACGKVRAPAPARQPRRRAAGRVTRRALAAPVLGIRRSVGSKVMSLAPHAAHNSVATAQASALVTMRRRLSAALVRTAGPMAAHLLPVREAANSFVQVRSEAGRTPTTPTRARCAAAPGGHGADTGARAGRLDSR